MKQVSPFILKRHDSEFPKIQELREEHIAKVSGGFKREDDGGTVLTIIVTPNGDGGDPMQDAE